MPPTMTKTTAPFALKAAETSDGRRIVSGLASTWNIDLGNDQIKQGAFARTLGRWRPNKDKKPIPLIDQHNYGSSLSVIGKMIEAKETAEGLEVVFEMAKHQQALDVFQLIEDGMITGLSIGYEAKRWEFEQDDSKPAWERTRIISELKLMEVSAVIWPMNDEARIDGTSIKSLIDVSNSRPLTPEELQQLQDFHTEISALLAKQEPAPEENPPAEPETPGLATPEEVAEAIARLNLLKLRRPASHDVSDSARAVESNPRDEESNNVSTGGEEEAA